MQRAVEGAVQAYAVAEACAEMLRRDLSGKAPPDQALVHEFCAALRRVWRAEAALREHLEMQGVPAAVPASESRCGKAAVARAVLLFLLHYKNLWYLRDLQSAVRAELSSEPMEVKTCTDSVKSWEITDMAAHLALQCMATRYKSCVGDVLALLA